MPDPHLPHALRILARDIHCEDGIATQAIREAADEIERLRSQPCPYVTGNVTRYCTLTPFTLTDAEREAVDDGVRCVEYVAAHGQPARADLASSAATLRGLLNRLSPIKTAECDRPKPIATPQPQSTPAERSVATERT